MPSCRHLPAGHPTQAGEVVVPYSFQYPDRLFELQELVLVHGSSYWNDVPRPSSLAASSARNFQALETELRKKSVKRSSNPVQHSASPRNTMSRRAWLATTAAATFTVGLGLGWLIPRANPSVGGMAWTRPDAFRPATNGEEFLTRLATLAKEWFDERPATRTQLANRIIDFRNGCARLQLNVAVIPAADRTWLVADCRKWSGKLDQHLIALEDGRALEVVQQEVDETIQKLITKLNSKARPA